MRTSGDKSLISLHCVAKIEKVKREAELGEGAHTFLTRCPHSMVTHDENWKFKGGLIENV